MKTIRDFDLTGKKVIIRVDFNVPIENGMIQDDTRIKESLETIKYACNHDAKVILMSHLGRVKVEEDKKNTLLPVAKRVGELLGQDILFIPKTRGKELEEAIDSLKNGQILLMENTRFEDLDGQKESKNDTSLGKYWASLGDIYINDAFGTSHRAHASNVGIATYLESGIGFLIEKELKSFKPILENPERPFLVLLGGSKVSDKIGVIENLIHKADTILIGGGMAFTFLKASGLEIGNSIFEESSLIFCQNLLKNYPDKIILPIDFKIETGKEIFISDMKKENIGLDIGSKTITLFKQYLTSGKTILWNGPMGKFEEDEYAMGTKGICEILKNIDAIKIAGGGDTASAIKKFGYENSFTHISTGGGASLELLEGKPLPGIASIQ